MDAYISRYRVYIYQVEVLPNNTHFASKSDLDIAYY